MRFKGKLYRESKKVVTLPDSEWNGEQKNYVAFGRICPKNTPGAILCPYIYYDGSPFGDSPDKCGVITNKPIYYIYAVRIGKEAKDPYSRDDSGYSLTNLMYGNDGYAYLFSNGKCYVRRWKKASAAAKAEETRHRTNLQKYA